LQRWSDEYSLNGCLYVAMDDLLLEFLTETNESLDIIDVELVKFEQDPNNAQILSNIFRLVHTIKGTCGFLGLPRLEALAHAAETLMGKFRDGMPVTNEAVTLILFTIDRLKEIIGDLETLGSEPDGDDTDLISQLEQMSQAGNVDAVSVEEIVALPNVESVSQELERALRPGEVSLEELERAFRETECEVPELSSSKLSNVISEANKSDQISASSKNDLDVVAEKKRKPSGLAAASDKVDDIEGAAGGVSTQSIRVGVDTLETLMTMVSELVLTRNQLLEMVRRHENSEFKVPLQRLSNVTAELQEGVMKTRMQPIGNAWQKLPRIVRDLANELGKNIELEMHGAETELDRQVLDLIKDPLTHMVRNSADHGLEMPSDRLAKGKSEKGTIKLSAYHEGGHIIIEIADDGRGLDMERIKSKVIANGLATESELEKMSEAQIAKYIFAPGFSTAAAITSVSGRGVGMDVVKTNIDAIGGTIDLKSVPNEGSVFMIKIPLTLAIVSALIVEAAGNKFAIPQISVVELVRSQANAEHKIEKIKDTPVLRLRNKLLPLIQLAQLLGMSESSEVKTENAFIVVTQVGQQTFGIVVDGVFHTEEIVVKPMSSKLKHITMFSGNTILGDGSVIMIIDPNGIAKTVGSGLPAEAQNDDMEAAKQADVNRTTSMLVFRAGSEDLKAIPLSLITRLEEIDAGKIENSSGRPLVQYRGGLMPLVPASETVKLRQEGGQPLLVISDDGRSMGLIVDDIVDIVDDYLDIQVASDVPGVLGSAVVKGRATEILDVGHFMPLAFEDWLLRKEKKVEASTHKLLFVDDSPFFRNMLTPVLKAAGYTVTTVSSGEEALQALKEAPVYDIIVSDIEMPGMSGFELAEAIRSDIKLSKLPIIALSSLTNPGAIERGKAVGFVDYVAKFDRQGLIAALKDTASECEVAA
jgi:two-component system, chemotaxis family, sensor kinase CheA